MCSWSILLLRSIFSLSIESTIECDTAIYMRCIGFRPLTLSMQNLREAKMNFTQIDESLGISSLLTQMGASAGEEGFKMPSATLIAAAGSSALIGYALWEQVKFRMYRAGKKELVAGVPFEIRSWRDREGSFSPPPISHQVPSM